MNLTDILFIAKSHGIKPDASLSDILLAKKLDGGVIRTIKGNPLRFSARKAQKAKNPSLTMLPVQDLHGYDHAWIGGMGKNLLDPSTLVTDITNPINGVQWTYDNNGKLTFTGTLTATSSIVSYQIRGMFEGNYSVTVELEGTTSDRIQIFVYNNTYSRRVYKWNGTDAMSDATYSYPVQHIQLNKTDSITVNVRTLISSSTPISVKVMIVGADETSSAWQPYENICPISGRTMSSVWGSKKNMLPTSLSTIKSLNTTGVWNGNAYTINNVTFTVQMEGDKVVGINANGQASADATLFIYGNTTANFSSTTITFKGSGRIRIGTQTNGSSTTFLGVVWSTIQNKFIYGTELFDSGYTMNGFGVRIKNGYNAQNILFKPIISMADEDYTFEPYEQSCFINFTFGRTVYGGKVDFDTGVMSIDTLRVDLGTLNWNTTSTSGVFYADDDLGEFIGTGKTIVSCDSFLCCDNASGLGQARLNPNGSICGYSGSGTHRWYIRYDGITSKTDLVAAVNGVYACYKLATPQTIQLTPQDINLLKGVNNIWTDGDTIELTYKA